MLFLHILGCCSDSVASLVHYYGDISGAGRLLVEARRGSVQNRSVNYFRFTHSRLHGLDHLLALLRVAGCQ